MSLRQVACSVAISITVITSGVAYADKDDRGDGHRDAIGDIIQQGFAISPIPKNELNFKGKDPFRVGLGSYLVNAAADCSGCHSFPRFLVNGDTAGSNPSFNDPYLGVPSDQSVKQSPLRANFNNKHYLAGGRCFGPFQSQYHA